MATHNTSDGLSTVSELRPTSYLWFVGVLALSGSMVYYFQGVDSGLYLSKNKFINTEEYTENRLSASSLPHTNHDLRGKSEYKDAVENLAK